MTKYEMYLSIEEFITIRQAAIEILQSYTYMACEGYWKQEKTTTVILIYFADQQKHYRRFKLFYEIAKQKLEVAHYIETQCKMKLHKKEVKQYV